MKTLLAVGCSFTDENFISKLHPEMDCSWPKWPEVLSKKLGYEVVNLGRRGNSNDAIFKSAQDYIIDHKVDMICALWTQATRLNIHDIENYNWMHSFSHIPEISKWFVDIDKQKNFINIDKFSKLLSWKHTALANEHLRYVYMLDQLGKYNNIPVYHMQGVRIYFAFTVPNDVRRERKHKEYLNAVLDSPYFKILDKQTNIYGWPFYTTLGGKTFKQPIPWVSTDIKEHIISESDGHPNGKGHQKIASRFMEIIK
jgi:hypothetical protein